jgi:hypothetical protein
MIRHKIYFILIIQLSIFKLSFGQSTYQPLGSNSYHIIDRLEIKSGNLSSQLHTSAKPYRRSDIAQTVDSFDISNASLSKRDYFNLGYIQADNPDFTRSQSSVSKKPLLKYFYKHKNAIYSVKENDFELYINPVIELGGGRELSPARTLKINTRGVELRGKISNKIGFYSFITDNQWGQPKYIQQFVDSAGFVMPGVGFLKSFKKQANVYDYFNSRGYITFSPVKPIQFQFGQDKNFIGNGVRSLVLSDFTNDYLFLKINTKVWKLNYQNLFMRLTDLRSNQSKLFSTKYAAIHHISINLAKKFNIGFFESIIFSRKDSTGRNQGFDPSYVNPIIFYRSIEQNNNSADNALLGMDWKYNFLHHFSFYGQLTMDEFLVHHLIKQDGFYANKYAIQVGGKYIDVLGIKNFDIQVEHNFIRPYTYAHFNPTTSYTNYGQPLAHPLGANLKEIIFIIRYQPTNRINLMARFFHIKQGIDTGAMHSGSNINENYYLRAKDYGNEIGQGVKQTTSLLNFTASWMPAHNIFFDFNYTYRKLNSTYSPFSFTDQIISLSLRMNLAKRYMEF